MASIGRSSVIIPSEKKLDPQERLKKLINYSNMVQVDPHVPPIKYYRSGLEMVRMANVYYDEGSLENAYVLYLKFMTLFLEKIRKHPNFQTVPANTKAVNQAKMREVLPRAEKLKQMLLEQYKQDFDIFIKDKEEKERAQKEISKQKKDDKPKPPTTGKHFITADIAGKIDDVSYPDPNLPSAPPAPVTGASTVVPKPMESTSGLLPSAPSEFPADFPPPPYNSLQDASIGNKGPAAPIFDRNKKPADLDKYDRETLRPVVVPTKVLVLFLSLAQSNTAKNVETCGVLAGKLEKNELIITHMILPKQNGTSDSCTTLNEEELFDYQDQHNLITIGWIHTHPTQTSFLSSVDLHTHCSYQLLMPEAVAIVCSPKYNETGYFILTPNYGLQFIANCRKTGFHPHPTDPPLFKVAEHVRVDSHAPLEVRDLRKY